MPVAPLEIVKWRVAHEEKVLGASGDRLKTVVLRPGVVYGLSGGLTAILFESAEKGTVSIPGDGNNRWPMVHVRDLAYAYVTCAEKEIGGMILNVVDDSSVTLRELAESTARAWGLNNSISTIDPETALKQFGSLLQGLTIDLKVDNSRIKRLGWKVHHAPFINESDIYLNAWKEHRGMQDF